MPAGLDLPFQLIVAIVMVEFLCQQGDQGTFVVLLPCRYVVVDAIRREMVGNKFRVVMVPGIDIAMNEIRGDC